MRWIKWGLATLAVAVAGGALLTSAFSGGAAYAEGPSGATGPSAARSAYEAALAQRLGISVDQLQSAQKATLDQMIDQAAASGKLTADQAAKLKSAKPGEMRGHRLARLGGRVRGAIGKLVDSAAKTIGVSSDGVKTELQQGKSLQQIAAEHNVSPAQLKAGMTADIQAQVQAAVAGGKLTQEQANKMLSNLSERLDKAIQRQGGQHQR